MKACEKCGGVEVYSTGRCKACTRERVAAYRAANPDKWKASQKAQYEKNKEKWRAQGAEWRLANPEKIALSVEKYQRNHSEEIKERARLARMADPERFREAYRRYCDKHPSTVAERHAKWKRDNKDKVRIYTTNRRAKLRLIGGKLSVDIARKLLILQKGKCACCKRRVLGRTYHLDHIHPLFMGGNNTDQNIQILCGSCNCSKGSKHPVDFMKLRGYLL